MNTNLSKTFDLLRFPLAILVVYLHIAPVISPLAYVDVPTDAYYYVNKTVCLIAACAVPCFFLISGYLLVFNIKKLTISIYGEKLRKRVKTLLIPYIIWNVMAFVYLKLTRQWPDSVTFSALFLAPANFPLWFVRNLIVMVVLFPLFWWFGRWFKWYGFFSITLAFVVLPVPAIHRFTVLSVYFFYTGIIGGIYKAHLDNFLQWMKCLCVAIFLILFMMEIFANPERANALYNAYLLSGVGAFLMIAHTISLHSVEYTYMGLLASSSFFIFVSHKLGATYIAKAIVGKLSSSSEVAVFMVGPLLATLLCFVVYATMRRYTPKLLGILTGGK